MSVLLKKIFICLIVFSIFCLRIDFSTDLYDGNTWGIRGKLIEDSYFYLSDFSNVTLFKIKKNNVLYCYEENKNRVFVGLFSIKKKSLFLDG